MTTTNTNDNNDDRIIKTKTRSKKKKKKETRTVGAKANTTQWHLSFLLFGGPAQYKTKTGEIKTFRLRNAFSEGLSHDYLRGSAEKTGYLLPNSRVLLKSPKLRHELFDGADDESKTPHQIMIENFEKQNKESVAFLLSRDYDLAKEMLLPLQKISEEEQDHREERAINAVPNTRQF